MADVVIAGFLCGTCRVAAMMVHEEAFIPYVGDWHQDVAHPWDRPGPQALLQEANRLAFEYALLRLARNLDVEEAPGKTVLDNSLLFWAQESGEVPHDSRAPVITFGSAGGALGTGNFCDYRNRTPKGMRVIHGELGYSGLLYNQWLATCLRAMGIPQSE